MMMGTSPQTGIPSGLWAVLLPRRRRNLHLGFRAGSVEAEMFLQYSKTLGTSWIGGPAKWGKFQLSSPLSKVCRLKRLMELKTKVWLKIFLSCEYLTWQCYRVIVEKQETWNFAATSCPVATSCNKEKQEKIALFQVLSSVVKYQVLHHFLQQGKARRNTLFKYYHFLQWW